jgi:hypothetical protein
LSSIKPSLRSSCDRLDAQRVVAFSPGRFQDAPAPAGTAVEDVAAL